MVMVYVPGVSFWCDCAKRWHGSLLEAGAIVSVAARNPLNKIGSGRTCV